MDSLIEKLERAGEGSRELSDDVLLAIGWRYVQTATALLFARPDGVLMPVLDAPDPTRNVQDAIDWLVPEGWDWAVSTMVRDHLDKPLCHAEIAKANTGVAHIRDIHEVEAATPALAITIAALKAWRKE